MRFDGRRRRRASSPPGCRPRRPRAVATDADGVAEVRWLLNPAGPTTQTLTIRRLDDHGQPVDAPPWS